MWRLSGEHNPDSVHWDDQQPIEKLSQQKYGQLRNQTNIVETVYLQSVSGNLMSNENAWNPSWSALKWSDKVSEHISSVLNLCEQNSRSYRKEMMAWWMKTKMRRSYECYFRPVEVLWWILGIARKGRWAVEAMVAHETRWDSSNLCSL